MKHNRITGMASFKPGDALKPHTYETPELAPDEVLIAVDHCGVCHSDLSMLNNDWGMTQYPIVAGHEVVGKIAAVGSNVTTRKVGEPVGLGWYSQSCMTCYQCMSGSHNLCPSNQSTIVGRNGGFATAVRAHWAWATPLIEGLDPKKVGPLFCGGITVFNPIVQFNIQPTDRVAVIGIGGLGHLALQFLNKWGCEVTALSSSLNKKAECLQMGAHDVVNVKEAGALQKLAGRFNFILSTVNVPMNWSEIMATLAPKGRLHTVGAVSEPIALQAFQLISSQYSLSGTPLGSPATTTKMLEFCARHKIEPITEHFKMSEINSALKHLEEGKARYRLVLENDLA